MSGERARGRLLHFCGVWIEGASVIGGWSKWSADSLTPWVSGPGMCPTFPSQLGSGWFSGGKTSEPKMISLKEAEVEVPEGAVFPQWTFINPKLIR